MSIEIWFLLPFRVKRVVQEKLKEGKITSAEYETLIEKLPRRRSRYVDSTQKPKRSQVHFWIHTRERRYLFEETKHGRSGSQRCTSTLWSLHRFRLSRTPRSRVRYFIFRNEFLLCLTGKDAHKDDAIVPNGIYLF